MSKLSEYLRKPSSAFICGCLVTAIGTSAFERVKDSFSVDDRKVVEAIEGSLPIDNSAEIENYRVVAKEFDRVQVAKLSLVYENDRLRQLMDSLVVLYDELEAVHLSLDNRVSPREEIKILAGVATDWMKHKKENMIVEGYKDPVPDTVTAIPVSAAMGGLKSQGSAFPLKGRYDWMKTDPVHTFIERKIDYVNEASRLKGELGGLKQAVKDFTAKNERLRSNLVRVMQQLDTLHQSTVLEDYDVELAVGAISKYLDVVSDYIGEKTDVEIASSDEVGDLIRELNEVSPSRTAMP